MLERSLASPLRKGSIWTHLTDLPHAPAAPLTWRICPMLLLGHHSLDGSTTRPSYGTIHLTNLLHAPPVAPLTWRICCTLPLWHHSKDLLHAPPVAPLTWQICRTLLLWHHPLDGSDTRSSCGTTHLIDLLHALPVNHSLDKSAACSSCGTTHLTDLPHALLVAPLVRPQPLLPVQAQASCSGRSMQCSSMRRFVIQHASCGSRLLSLSCGSNCHSLSESSRSKGDLVTTGGKIWPCSKRKSMHAFIRTADDTVYTTCPDYTFL